MSSTQADEPQTNDKQVFSLRKLNPQLLIRVHAAECAVERLQQAQGANSAIIVALQPKIAELEERSREKKHELCAVREVAAQREQESCELRAIAERREGAIVELIGRVRSYEVEMDEKGKIMAKLEEEGHKLKKLMREMEREKNEPLKRVEDRKGVAEGLKERVKKTEHERWGGAMSFGTFENKSGGKRSIGAEIVVADEEQSWWEWMWEWVQRAWMSFVGRRGQEMETLFGKDRVWAGLRRVDS